ncbi:3'5'-cyclic nucleotide phosphodiesterase domain protein, partial [Toxoplasma gondii RUB]
LSVPVRTDALIQILARALDSVEGCKSADASSQEESEIEPEVPFMPGELVYASPRSEGGKLAAGPGRKSLLVSCERSEANEASGKGGDSSPQKKKRNTFRISVARRRTLRASASPHSQRESSVTSEAARHRNLLSSVFRGKDSPPRRSSRDTNDKASLSDDSKDKDGSDDEPVELFPLHNETLQPLFPGGDQIPEPLLFDVNSVVQAVNQVGLSRPAEQLAAAIAQTPFQKDLDASAKFIDALDSSLALLRYYQTLPGRDGSLQKRRRSRRMTDLDPQGTDRTWRPESKRKSRDGARYRRSVSPLSASGRVRRAPQREACSGSRRTPRARTRTLEGVERGAARANPRLAVDR